MASVSGSRRTLEARSGGKIVRSRRTGGSRTPYDRPRVAGSEEAENPSWISRLIFSPSRAIASGAGKLISSVFSQDDSESDSDSDSDSSPSSSDGDSGSEENVGNDQDDDGFLSQRDDILKERKTNSEMINYFRNGPELTAGKRDTKCAIEELIMQETFTREECKNLIKMIKSRVVDLDTTASKDMRLTQTPKQIPGEADEQELRCTAVMEARKWLSEKKLRSASKSDVDNVVQDEVGSPVNMAKLYMRTRPLWASPTFKQGEFSSLSPAGTHLFKDETPYSRGRTASSKPKRDTTGPWNIQEEIQRVRAKATEEMLSTLPSKKIDLSSFALEKRASPKPLLAEDIYAKAIEKVCSATKSIDASFEMMAGGLERTPAKVTIIPDQDLEGSHILHGIVGSKDGLEDMECEEQRLQSSPDINTIDGGDIAPDHGDTNATDRRLNDFVEESIQDPRLLDSNCSTSKEVPANEIPYNTNGLPISEHSLSEETLPGKDTGEQLNPVTISSSSEKIADDTFEGVTGEIRSEPAAGIPDLNDAMNGENYAVNGSPSRGNQSPRYTTRQGPKRSLANDKKQGKRLAKTNKKKPGIPT